MSQKNQGVSGGAQWMEWVGFSVIVHHRKDLLNYFIQHPEQLKSVSEYHELPQLE
jgi:hypothetical protein